MKKEDEERFAQIGKVHQLRHDTRHSTVHVTRWECVDCGQSALFNGIYWFGSATTSPKCEKKIVEWLST